MRGNKRVEGSGYPVGGERVPGVMGRGVFSSLPPYLPTPPQIKF
ncbi:hypothetical protein M595_0721 [Lyngbya aestuarii BL J]|uniref:Uncharacterized protein n=1 Tax=Lyngbya aestuarii BL J TaxID=1348334 RepID=U7QS44_9CYAN|nr:hypothetical protein M595_1017 [Lyngbya aestuarii BL J]ERT09236.1 hypothetical protein M595_0721 [Lyngbya aestuarii BL J]